VKILLDECTPRVLKKRLAGFSVQTVQDVGWQGIKNGELLRRIGGRFDVLITTDKNLRHQHDLNAISFAVIVLPSNRITIVAELIEPIRQALQHIQAGQIVEVPLPQGAE
jgi:hypothetical protein